MQKLIRQALSLSRCAAWGVTMLAAIPVAAAKQDFAMTMERMQLARPEFLLHIDTEHDFATAGKLLTRVYRARMAADPQMPPIPIDFERAFGHLGLTDLLSVTNGSTIEAGGPFRNEWLLRFRESPAGLFQLLGASNQTFHRAQDAPPDTDFYMEFSLNGELLPGIARKIAAEVMGQFGIDVVNSQLEAPALPDGSSIASLLQRLSQRAVLAAKSPEALRMNSLPDLATAKWVLSLEGAGALLSQLLPSLKLANLSPLADTALPTWQLNLEDGLTLLLQHDMNSGNAMLSTNEASFTWYREHDSSLGDQAAFMAFTDRLPASGIAFWYTSHQASEGQLAPLRNLISGPNQAAVNELLAYIQGHSGAQGGAAYIEGDALRATSFHPASTKSMIGFTALLIPLSLGLFDDFLNP